MSYLDNLKLEMIKFAIRMGKGGGVFQPHYIQKLGIILLHKEVKDRLWRSAASLQKVRVTKEGRH